jgi:Flp pilus assembly protein TadD
LRVTLETEPGYANARYNLARALEAQGDAEAAISIFASYVKDYPEDAQARVHLSSLYITQRRYDQALPHILEAARLKPNDADTATNLGSVLALTGDLAGAIAAYERALKIDPNHKTARENLERARSAKR